MREPKVLFGFLIPVSQHEWLETAKSMYGLSKAEITRRALAFVEEHPELLKGAKEPSGETAPAEPS